MGAGNPWRVTGREHPWSTANGSGYIDLVLSNGNTHLVIESKRSRDATWMFLMPDVAQMSRSHACVCWTDTMPHRRALSGWGDTQVYPNSPESEFCIVRGQGEGDKPLLERLASSVVESTDGLSHHFLELGRESRTTNVVIPVIVTNAQLVAARFHPKQIDLLTGELPSADYSAVPHLRFRKSLAAASSPFEYDPESLEDLAAGSERTVFVVRGSELTNWLEVFQRSASDSSSPWESARGAADAMGV